MTNSADNRGTDIGLLLLRVAVGGIMLPHGIFKLMHGVEWIKEPLAALHLPGFLAYGVYAAEVVAPVLLILGIGTRLAAGVVAFDMLMAIGLAKRPSILAINRGGGGWAIELEALFFFTALALALTGPGRIVVWRPGAASAPKPMKNPSP